MKWALELEKFDVFYKPQTAIKGQALANFLAEFTYIEDPIEEVILPDLQLAIPTQVLYVDGSSNKQGSGAAIILTTSKGIQLE